MAEPALRERILDAAEIRARQGGYNGFSFHELADDVGAASARVQAHFPTKADLVEALVRRYVERSRDRLGDPANLLASEALARMIDFFRMALIEQDQMCLCGLLGAERDALPAPVIAEVARFFRMLLDYLQDAFAGETRYGTPETIVACLEGGLMMARSLGDIEVFDIANPEPW